jgi:hypothetical protein
MPDDILGDHPFLLELRGKSYISHPKTKYSLYRRWSRRRRWVRWYLLVSTSAQKRKVKIIVIQIQQALTEHAATFFSVSVIPEHDGFIISLTERERVVGEDTF